MAEAEGAEGVKSAKASVFDTEVLMLMREEIETVEKRSKARLAKDVKVQRQDVTKPLVVKPIWPYEIWHVNYLNTDSASETRPSETLREISENQVSNWDDVNSLEPAVRSCDSEVCEADNEESSRSTDQGTEPPGVVGTVQSAQRTINELFDLLNLLSSLTEKVVQSDSGSPNTDSMTNKDEQTETTMGTSETALAKKNIDWIYADGDAKHNSSLAFELNVSSNSCLIDSSGTLMPSIQGGAHNAEKVKMDSKDPLPMECEGKTAHKTPETEESSPCIPGVHDVYEDTMNNIKIRSEETTETMSGGKRAKFDCKDSEIKMSTDLVHETDLEQDMRGRHMDETPKLREKINTSKIPHFKTELQSPVSSQSVLYNSIRNWLPNISVDPSVKTDYIRQFVRSLMDDTVHELQEKYYIFSKCYIVETGSMAEGTKIGQPDEFDFNVALPILANSDVTELLYTKLGIQTHLHNHVYDRVLSFLQQFPFVDSSYRRFLTNAYLLLVFRETLRKQLPRGWVMLEESYIHAMRVFLKNQTLTVHLQCNSGPHQGFHLSIDICYGIPLDAERLHTVYVSDVTHAVHLSFIQSECLRMSTEVLAVISQNPLVGRRFFFRTEPCRFYGNELAADCYKLAKHLTRIFLPKILKNECNLCEDTLIPSFYLKTVVSFMMDVYTEKSEWSDTQRGNRLIEIFEIIRFCFMSKYRTLAHYSYINSMKVDDKMKYVPKDGVLKVGIGMEDEKPCTIPCMGGLSLPSSLVNIGTAVQSYWKYMKCEEWTVGELLSKLIELLYVLKFTEISTLL